MSSDGILLLAHGTVSEESELPGFLTRIRRGREPSPELLREMQHRYRSIGGSPLTRLTQQQASRLSRASGLPCFVAMRLWKPEVESVLPEMAAAGVRRACVLPLAPFSVEVYERAARQSQSALQGPGREIELLGVPPWGEHPDFVRAQTAQIRRHLPPGDCELILTAHSLPLAVVRAGDTYATQVQACAAAIERELGRRVHLAYQSQGADGGEWLGPELRATLQQLVDSGARHFAIAPFGFLAEHVETLYDLDVEARSWTDAWGVELTRIPTLGDDPEFIAALAAIARATLGQA